MHRKITPFKNNEFTSFNFWKTACFFVAALFVTGMNYAQTAASSMDITGSNSTNTITNNTVSYVDQNILVTANGTINGFIVTITDSYTSGDVLSYTGSLPGSVSAVSFNTTTRSLVFNGSATAAQWQDLLRRVTLQTTSATCFPESRKVAFIAGDCYFNPLNNHYYRYRSTGESWTTAKAFAETQSYFGRIGYLATISEQSENSFISILIGQNSWIGCSDNYSVINTAAGYTKYAAQSNAEGKFHWVTGPEKGTQIRLGNAVAPAVGGAVAGVYQNWGGSEPNDYPTNNTYTLSQEDYGHMYSGTGGLWNDFPNTQSIGSVIEFGGMPLDNTTSQVVFTRNIYINGAPSGTITGGNTSVCPGGSATLTLSGLSGSVVSWEYSLDNFLTAGTTIVNTTTTLSLTGITETRYYRAIVNSSSGCSSLATSSTPVYVSNTIAGNIAAANNIICPGSQAAFTLFGNNGSVINWQVSTSSTFASGNTTIANTSTTMSYTLASTGTYYFRAQVQNNGCTAVYTNIYTITVTSGTAPVGGTVTSEEYCGGSNAGTLTLSGHTGSISKWQYSIDGGIVWTDISNTTTSQSFSGITSNRMYRALVTNGSCGSAYSSNGSITVYGSTVTKWLGTTSTNWGDASNWCGGIADNGMDVVVTSSAPNNLVLDQNRLVGSFNFNGSNKIIILGNNTLTANGFTGTSSLNYVQTNGTGKLKMNVANNSTVLFPVSNSAYNPVSITNNSGNSDDFSVRVLDEVYTNGLTGAVMSTSRIKRTWDISKTYANGGSGINFTFNWNPAEVYNVTTPMLNHYNGTDWDAQTGASSSTANSMTYVGYTGTFSPFAISNSGDPLPVTLTQFSATCETENTTIEWQTASEQNSDVFVIERSENGKDWSTVDEVAAAGNSNTMINYMYKDYGRSRGLNYYQLQQIDVDGKITTYGPISAMCDIEIVEIAVFPNPTDGDFAIEISAPQTEKYLVIFETADGHRISEMDYQIKEGMNIIPMHAKDLDAGVYFIRVVNGTDSYLKKVVIK
jgi:hypothetical protein